MVSMDSRSYELHCGFGALATLVKVSQMREKAMALEIKVLTAENQALRSGGRSDGRSE